MTGERTIPILPCRALDDVIPFYEAFGFEVAYRQARPNPYGVVRRDDLDLHFAAIDGFDPQTSYASAIVLVDDADELHRAFAEGLRAAYGRLPASGIRACCAHGPSAGRWRFSVIDPGGNWLRVYRAGRP